MHILRALTPSVFAIRNMDKKIKNNPVAGRPVQQEVQKYHVTEKLKDIDRTTQVKYIFVPDISPFCDYYGNWQSKRLVCRLKLCRKEIEIFMN